MPVTFRRGPLYKPAHDVLGAGEVEVETLSEWTEQMAAKKPVNSPCEQPISIGGILKPGVYLLLRYSKVVFIGKSKCLLATIAAHRAACSGPRLPEWFPIHRVQFDDVQIIPCALDRAGLLLPALIDMHQPTHNIHPKHELSRPTFQVPKGTEGAAPRITRRI